MCVRTTSCNAADLTNMYIAVRDFARYKMDLCGTSWALFMHHAQGVSRDFWVNSVSRSQRDIIGFVVRRRRLPLRSMNKFKSPFAELRKCVRLSVKIRDGLEKQRIDKNILKDIQSSRAMLRAGSFAGRRNRNTSVARDGSTFPLRVTHVAHLAASCRKLFTSTAPEDDQSHQLLRLARVWRNCCQQISTDFLSVSSTNSILALIFG